MKDDNTSLTIIRDARGGVRLQHPPDLHDVSIRSARDRGYPGLGLPVSGLTIGTGSHAWSTFVARADEAAVCEALLVLDDLPPRAALKHAG